MASCAKEPSAPIEGIALTHVRVPLVEPFRISHAEVAAKDAIIVRLRCGDAVGYGESSPMAGAFYSAETPDSCWRALIDVAAPWVLERQPSLHPDGGQAAPAALDPLADLMPHDRFAFAGIETAMWDLCARLSGASLAAALGAARTEVESGLAVGLYDTIERLLATIHHHLPYGYRRLKIKIKRGHDIELVRAVRAEFGDDLPLFVDANAGYDVSDIEVFRALDEFGLMMFEQPFAGHDLEGLAQLQRQVRTPVCIDESAEDVTMVERALDLDAARIVNIKVQRVGGLLRAKQLHDLCAARGIPAWCGTMPELGLGQAQGLAIAALPNCVFPTDIEPSARWFTDDIIRPWIEMDERGMITVPQAPGTGYHIAEDTIEKYALRQWESRA
jgi:O-succinylbenzoate synthase